MCCLPTHQRDVPASDVVVSTALPGYTQARTMLMLTHHHLNTNTRQYLIQYTVKPVLVVTRGQPVKGHTVSMHVSFNSKQ